MRSTGAHPVVDEPLGGDRVPSHEHARRRGLVLVALLVGLVGLAAAALAGIVSSGSGDGALQANGTEEPQSSDEPVVLQPASPYEKRTVPEGFAAQPVEGLWRLESVEGDDRTLVVRVATSGCVVFDHMTLDRVDDEAVWLRAWNEEWVAEPGYGCTGEAGVAPYRIELPEPLAGRAVEGQCQPRSDGADGPVDQCQMLVDSIESARDDTASQS